jgi:hypothetical protein
MSKQKYNPKIMVVDQKDVTLPRITVFESWEKIDGVVYYKWKREGDEDWHTQATPYPETPIVRYIYLTPEEYERKLRQEGKPCCDLNLIKKEV